MIRGVSTALAAALGLASVPPALAATHTVHVFDSDFSVNPPGQPIADPTIRVGDTVRWVWDSGFHSTTSVANIPEQWDSGVTGPGSEFSHTFTELGTWHYYCEPHGFDRGDGTAGGMAGTIRVVPEPLAGGTLTAVAGGLLLRRRRRVRFPL